MEQGKCDIMDRILFYCIVSRKEGNRNRI
jgi:hypothetical protein